MRNKAVTREHAALRRAGRPGARGLSVIVFTSALLAAAAWAFPRGRPAAASAPRAVAVRKVKTIADDGTADSLREVIKAAAPGDTIEFDVTGTIVLTRGQLTINKNLTINGPGKNLLTLSGANRFTGLPDVRVFDLTSTSATVTISALTIQSGKDDFDNDKNGGGIRNRATLFINDCIVQGNVAGAEGGGLYNDGGKVTIDNSEFLNNRSGQGGGGAFNKNGGTITVQNGSKFSKNHCNSGGGGAISNFNGNSSLTIDNSEVVDNSSPTGPGGAISTDGTLTVSNNSTIARNASLSKGGGIHVSTGTVNIDDSLVADNFTEQSGGGVYIKSGSVTINRSTFRHNSADDDKPDTDPDKFNIGKGGAIDNNDGTLTITASTFSDNRAKDFGGAINNRLADANIFDSTISNNTAAKGGGGISNETGFVTLRSCTVASNTAAFFDTKGRGGGIFFLSGPQGRVTLANTVVALNDGTASSPDISGRVTSEGFNLVGNVGGSTGLSPTADQTNVDPQLGPLQDNGGPTQTHAPLPGSRLIDAGKSASANDQRGLPRRFNHPSSGTAAGSDGSDIGALELQPIRVFGRVRDAGGAGVADVTLTLSGAQSALTSTQANGAYSFDVAPGVTFTLTPSKPGLKFSPASATFDVKGNIQDRQFNFRADPVTSPTPTPSPSDDFEGTTSDNFRIGQLSRNPAAFNPKTTVEQNGSLRITPPIVALDQVSACVDVTATGCGNVQNGDFMNDGSFDGQSFSGVVSKDALDLNVTTAVSLEVQQTVAGTGAQTIFSVGQDENNYYGFRVVGGAVKVFNQTLSGLTFDIVIGGVRTNTPVVLYNRDRHRHWRIRFDATRTPAEVIFETMRLNGTEWENPCPESQTCRFPVNAAFTEVAAQIIAGTITRINTPGSAVVDDYRVARPTGIGFPAEPRNFTATEKDRTIPLKLTRTGGADSRASVQYTVAGGGTSFTGGEVTFEEGQTDATFTIQNPFPDDTLRQLDRFLTLTLANPKGGALNSELSDATVTITDDDVASTPTLSVNDVTVAEGNAGTVNANFTVTLSAAGSQAVVVNYATSDGTATAGADYTAVTSASLTFAPGETTKSVAVVVRGDTLDEPDENFFVNLSLPTNATIGDGQGVGTIADDDPAPSLSINDAAVAEGNSGTTAATFLVTLSAASGRTVTVNYATENVTAAAPADYTATSGTLTFTPGQTSKTVNVAINGDTTPEEDETFVVNLSGVTNAAVSDAQGQGTITDDDVSTQTLSVNDVTVTEGNAGTTVATFTVTLSTASGKTVTVNYATADGTPPAATAGSDYTAIISTVLIFAPGETSKTINVPILGDTLDEPNERFFVNLSSPVNATIGDGQGVGTIIDDDGAPSLSIGDVTVTEGNAGTTAATFTVSLLPASGKTVTVNYATADGTAAQPGDYISASGTLTFTPGQTSQTITVQVAGDTLDESDETFNVNLSNPSNATLSDGMAVGTITDNDAPPTVSVTDATAAEGNSGTTGSAAFNVLLSSESGRAVTVNVATSDGTAAAGSDYAAVSMQLTFAPGETSKTVNVAVIGDTLDEPDENFFVNLSSPTNATIGDGQGVGTIADDDPAPSLSINDAAVAEGNSGTTTATFLVSLSAASGQTVTVNYATADGSATTANGDYQSANGTLTFTPGQTSKTVNVNVNGDTTPEEDETFVVNLSGVTNAAVSDAQGQGTVTDDDTFNKIDDDPVFFTSQQYCDFLNRPPDPSGLAFWTNEIEKCGADEQCKEVKRVHVSAAFFLSIESQQTNYFVYRAYQATFARMPSRDELTADARAVRGEVIVNQGEWEKELEQNKRDFLAAWMQRPAVKEKLDALDNGPFVDALYKNAGVTLTPGRRTELLLSLLTGLTTRRNVLAGLLDSKAPPDTPEARESEEFRRAHLNRAFVLMQYFGYLQRDPDAKGYQFWLDKLDGFGGDFVRAEMVKAFVTSDEYRERFVNKQFATCVGR